jgi:hypothetical protein
MFQSPVYIAKLPFLGPLQLALYFSVHPIGFRCVRARNFKVYAADTSSLLNLICNTITTINLFHLFFPVRTDVST